MSGDFRRVNRGRYHQYFVGDRKLPGVTTILGDGLPKPALVGWAAGTVGEFVADRLQIVDGHILADDVVDDLAAIGAKRERPIPDWKQQGKLPRTKLADGFKGLPYADRDAAGNRGTEVHKLAQRLAEGEEIDVPDELVGHVDAYLKFREDWQPYDELLEVSVVNRTHLYAGTLDILPIIDALGGRLLIDVKTNRSGPFGEVALQLAAYRYAEEMLDPTSGELVPMPEVEGCYCLWLRSDGYDLYPFEAGPAEFRAFLYVQQVAFFCNERSKQLKGASLPVPARAS